MTEGRERMRASDADREAVAERLRAALDEGRLDLGEYDERLQRAYTSKTYAELDGLLADLPAPASVRRSELASHPAGPLPMAVDPHRGPDGRYPHATRQWLAETWGGYATTVAIVVAIWMVISVLSGRPGYFWPGWVAGPWGAVLLVVTISGLFTGEPRRWAAKRERQEQTRREKRAHRERVRERRRDGLGPVADPGGEAGPAAR